jgi:MobA/MobL family
LIEVLDLQAVHLYVGPGQGIEIMNSYFHLNLGVVRRSLGGSAERRSAYQSRTCLTLPNGTVIDYSTRGSHIETFMLAPPGAPDWAKDRTEFWRRAAAAEKRADAQEARLLELSIPRGLSRADWTDLARKLGSVFVKGGMIVQVDIHCTTASDGGPAPHLHFMMSMRELENGQFAVKKARHWNRLFYGKAAHLRKDMANFLNAYCEKKGVAYQADPRSNAARGLPPAEMSVPRWNLFAYKRTGKKTPWLEQRDRERAARANIVALEAECEELEREIARGLVQTPCTPPTCAVSGTKRNESHCSRESLAVQRPIAVAGRQSLGPTTNSQKGFHSKPNEPSSTAPWSRGQTNEPEEIDAENTPRPCW